MRRAVLLGLMLAMAAPLAAQPTATDSVRAAAQAGDADAQFTLAQAYQLGRGVPADFSMASMWYRRAADQGHARASDELGFLLFSHGERKAAIPYVEKAAARGDARAFYLLGTAHFNGDLMTRDWPLAYAQTSRAAEAGLAAAQQNLEMMDRYLLPADKAKAQTILATLPPARGNAPAASPAAAAPARAAVPTARPAAPVSAPSRSAPAAARPTPPPAIAAGKGEWRAQLGAYGSQDRAEAGLARLTGKVASLASLNPRIVAAGAIRRVQVTGLSRADAEALCREVRSAKGDCLVIAP